MRPVDEQIRELLDAARQAIGNARSRDATHLLFLDDAADLSTHAAISDGSFAHNDLAQETLNSMGDAVISIDLIGNVTYLNPVAENLTGWARADALGRPVNDVVHIIDGKTRQEVRNPMLSAIESNTTSCTPTHWVFVRRDGSEFAMHDSAAPIRDRRGQIIGAVMVFRDVSASRAIALKIASLAQHDVLTGLPNRMLLIDRVEQAIRLARRHNQQFALLFVDMDGFKQINDALGHASGDQFLTAIAERLRNCVRDMDTVSRFGGDEFVVLLSEITDPADAVVCAYKINDELSRPFNIEESYVNLSASIGVGVYPKDGPDAETLLKSADQAMLGAKRNGRNRIQLSKALTVFNTARLDIDPTRDGL